MRPDYKDRRPNGHINIEWMVLVLATTILLNVCLQVAIRVKQGLSIRDSLADGLWQGLTPFFWIFLVVVVLIAIQHLKDWMQRTVTGDQIEVIYGPHRGKTGVVREVSGRGSLAKLTVQMFEKAEVIAGLNHYGGWSLGIGLAIVVVFWLIRRFF